ncbi:hypothetical protein [Vibrio mangrovi]|uniref:Uncharacterized protein n=1 Tax=Vibrio mangrovi TaxID=474394 RepID=A0A1Y6IP47_9VIBR|nr:hypothetical protein [Vibrio mangrovi]MDW6003771.1 hypothetical protein [Vibrio mangrovi]SMR99435.1 hypothetical protein VIM7927_00660 [Vibrio mangrovi]
MLNALISVLVPMAAGAQLILTLVLAKGEICPGQRGRIHRLLPVLLVLWLLVATQHLYVLLVVALTGYFYSQVKTGKTRQEGPLKILYLANVLAGITLLHDVLTAPNWIAAVMMVLSCLLLGTMAAHLLLTVARTRLQAFHRLLPVAGILAAMLLTLCIVPFTSGMASSQLQDTLQLILVCFSLLVTAVIIWSWHLLTTKSVDRIQLAISCLVLLTSVSGFHQLYFS